MTTPSQIFKIQWFLFAIGIAILLYLLEPILTPFWIALLFAYLGNPLVDYLTHYRLGRTLAASIILALMICIVLLFLGLVLPILEHQIIILIGKFPDFLIWLQQIAVPWLRLHLGIDMDVMNPEKVKELVMRHWQQAGNLAAFAWQTIAHSSQKIIAFLSNLVLIPLVTFYLLRDWRRLCLGLQQLLPRSHETSIVRMAQECNEVLLAFFRGQMLVMLCLGIFYSVALSLLGIEFSLLLGSLAGLLSIVPYLGFIIGLLGTTIAVIWQFHTWSMLLAAWSVFAIGHLLESFVFTPWFVGDRIGLHPVVVIFAILAGGELLGFLGVLIALPVAAILMVLIRHALARYLQSPIYSNKT